MKFVALLLCSLPLCYAVTIVVSEPKLEGPPSYSELRFDVPDGKDITTRAFSLSARVGMRNSTSGITLGKHNYATYAAVPDKNDANSVYVLGYQQLYYISPQPTCCKATLSTEEFRKAFEGSYLFTKIDSTWHKVNASTYEKVGPSDLGYPCGKSEHSEYDMSFTNGLPQSSFQRVVSRTPAGPGGPATCTSNKEAHVFEKVSTDTTTITKESAAAYDAIVDLCGTRPNQKCYF